MNKIFLDKPRLKTLPDSVLIVGIVLLVYNLATLAGSDPEKFESELFSNTLVAYINAFIIVFMYWSLLSVILDITLYLDDTLFLLILILLITLTLLPVANILFLQSSSQGAGSFCSLYSYCSRIIINSRNEIQKGSFASTKCYRVSVYSSMFDDNSFVVLNLICVLLLQHVCLKCNCFTCYTSLYCSWKNSSQEYLIQVERTLELRLAFACMFLT